MSGFSSNSKIFARRGNPWVSRREGEQQFGRNLETEDAEYDFDHRFHETGGFGKPSIAVPKPEYRDPKPQPQSGDDFSRRKANVLRKMNSSLTAHSQNFIRADNAPRGFKLCPGCRHAKCAATMSCHGNEIEQARRRGEANG